MLNLLNKYIDIDSFVLSEQSILIIFKNEDYFLFNYSLEEKPIDSLLPFLHEGSLMFYSFKSEYISLRPKIETEPLLQLCLNMNTGKIFEAKIINGKYQAGICSEASYGIYSLCKFSSLPDKDGYFKILELGLYNIEDNYFVKTNKYSKGQLKYFENDIVFLYVTQSYNYYMDKNNFDLNQGEIIRLDYYDNLKELWRFDFNQFGTYLYYNEVTPIYYTGYVGSFDDYIFVTSNYHYLIVLNKSTGLLVNAITYLELVAQNDDIRKCHDINSDFIVDKERKILSVNTPRYLLELDPIANKVLKVISNDAYLTEIQRLPTTTVRATPILENGVMYYISASDVKLPRKAKRYEVYLVAWDIQEQKVLWDYPLGEDKKQSSNFAMCLEFQYRNGKFFILDGENTLYVFELETININNK